MNKVYVFIMHLHCHLLVLSSYILYMFHQEAIFRTLAGILHLGNIDFSPGKEHDSSVIKDQKSNFHLQMAADLFRYVTSNFSLSALDG